jgi:hypothetical protein
MLDHDKTLLLFMRFTVFTPGLLVLPERSHDTDLRYTLFGHDIPR